MKTYKIAIQKSGRLNEKSVELLKKCGLQFENYKSSLISTVRNFPLEILFLRDDDIPEYVQDGIADLGIIGQNVLLESGAQVSNLQLLGFGKCKLNIAVKSDSSITSTDELAGLSIATSYPNLLQQFLTKENISANIRNISGSVEIGPGLGLSDAIFDIVSTGSTLKNNGLKSLYTVMESEALLIANPEVATAPEVLELVERIKSVLRAESTKYVVLNVKQDNLNAIVSLLPGVKSPTVIPLYEEGWVAVHSVINEEDFWEKINLLKIAGAQGIVVMPVEKIIS